MDIARIRLRSKGYDVFNAVVTANINGSLFHIKMTEEWCGPLQWIDNRCPCHKKEDPDEASDSDESNGDEPPLFTAEDGWYSSYEEEREGDESGSENEEEGEKQCDEETVVQETVGVINNEWRNNDCKSGDGVARVLEANDDVGNQRGVIGGDLNGVDEYGKLCKDACGDTRVTNLNGIGGAQEINSEMVACIDLVEGQGCMNKEGGFTNQINGVEKQDNEVGVDVRKEVGCEHDGRPIKIKPKRHKKCIGPQKKKKEKRMKKKEPEAHLLHQNTKECDVHMLSQNQIEKLTEKQYAEEQTESSHSAPSPQRGVVRNPFGHFQPNSSASNSINAVGS